MKKLLAIFLTFVMVLTIVPLGMVTTNAASYVLSESEFVTKLNKLRSKYPNGGKYSGTYYENGVPKASSCHGYACQMFYEVFGARFYTDGFSSKKDYNMGTIYAGDIVRLDAGNGPNTHTVFVTKVNSSRIYFTDANYISNNGIRWDASYSKSDFAKRFTYKVHISGSTLSGTGEATAVSNPWIKASKSNIFSDESIDFTFGADNATSYDLTVKHYDETVVSDKSVKSGVSYNFSDEGTYKAFITAKNGSNTVDSTTVSFYVVDALNFGSYFVTKLKNSVSGFYVAAETLNNKAPLNVYLASETSSSNNQWRFIRQEDCSYKVVNKQTGYCLDLEGAKIDNGTNIICSADSGADSQRWYIRKNLSGYALVSKLKLSSDLSITGNDWIYNDCIFDGANISLYSNDSVQSQRFDFEYTVSPINEWIKIDKTSLTSEEKLKFDFGAGYIEKYILHVELRDGSIIEKEIDPGDSISFDKSGRCTAYITCLLKDGTKINTDTVSFYNMKIHNLGKSFKTKIKNTASGFFVASQDFADDYDNVFIASEVLSDNNVWKFEQQKDGSYKIINAQTGYVLELEDGNVADKTNIICCPDDNSDAQRWFITSNMDGYALAPKNDYTQYLSVIQNDTIWWKGEHIDGANIVLYDLDNVQSQRLEFVDFIEVHDWKSSTCTVPKTCKICGTTSGTALGHSYTNACDTSCNVCKVTRGITHTYKTTTTKATLTKNGSVVKKCTVCGNVASTTTIKYAKTFKLSTTSYTYNGKVKKPTVTVKDSFGKKLKQNTDYTVSYAKGRKNVGAYKVTVKMKGNYSGTKTLTFKINPKKTSISKLTAAKKSLKVKIKKQSKQVAGYQIQYSTSKKFTNAKTKTVKSYKTTSATLKSLKSKKTYYVRVRTYKTVKGKKYYSAWSSYKSKKTK